MEILVKQTVLMIFGKRTSAANFEIKESDPSPNVFAATLTMSVKAW